MDTLMTLKLKFLLGTALIFLVAFTWSGWYILDVTELNPIIQDKEPPKGLPKVVFGIFLMLCMMLGMISNYLWDLFNANKSWGDITWRGVAILLIVSPIVFFSIWSVWKGDPIAFTLPFVAFQNGFFWQVIFSKAGPQ